MTAPGVDYATFITMQQGFEDVGGPWRLSTASPSAPVKGVSSTVSGSNRMTVTSANTSPSTIDVQPVLTANITLDLSIYANPRLIPFTWTYIPLWTRVGEGINTFHVRSGVGVNTWSDTYRTSAYTGTVATVDPSNKVTHTDYLTFTQTTGLASVTLMISNYVTNTTPTFQFVVSDVRFEIPASATSAVSSRSSTRTSNTINPTGTISGDQVVATASNSLSTGAIVGLVIGILALLAIIGALIFFFLRRNKQQHQQQVNQGQVYNNNAPPMVQQPWNSPHQGPSPGLAYPMPIGAEAHSPSQQPNPMLHPYGTTSYIDDNASTRQMLAYNPPPGTASTGTSPPPEAWRTSQAQPYSVPTWITSSSNHGGRANTAEASSITGPRSIVESPPYYGGSSQLATWARDNRNIITEDLEAKLANAGYVPTDNPDLMSQEIWMSNYGVSPLELARLKGLYAQTPRQA